MLMYCSFPPFRLVGSPCTDRGGRRVSQCLMVKLQAFTQEFLLIFRVGAKSLGKIGDSEVGIRGPRISLYTSLSFLHILFILLPYPLHPTTLGLSSSSTFEQIFQSTHHRP